MNAVGGRTFDWRTADGYPPPHCSDLLWWAWECLRRSKGYQEAYRKYCAFNGKEPSKHPIKDDDVLDSYFTNPRADLGCTFREFMEKHANEKASVMLWSEYIRRVWLLKKPVDPELDYGEHANFVNLRLRWRKNLDKKTSAAKLKRGGGARVISGDRELFPFDYFTEVAPNEMLVRIRLFADDKQDVMTIAKRLKARIQQYRKRFSPERYESEIHLVLRVWDFYEAARGLPPSERKSYVALSDALDRDDGWRSSVRRKTPSQATLSRMRKYARDLIEGRVYGGLVAHAQRKT